MNFIIFSKFVHERLHCNLCDFCINLVGYVLDLIESSLFDISATMSLSYHLGMFGDFPPLQKMIK